MGVVIRAQAVLVPAFFGPHGRTLAPAGLADVEAFPLAGVVLGGQLADVTAEDSVGGAGLVAGQADRLAV